MTRSYSFGSFRAVLAAALFACCLFHAMPARSENADLDRIVAVVNDEAVTELELRDRLTAIEHQLRQQGTPLPPEEVLEKQVLERLILDRAQLQLARETATQVDDAQLDSALGRIAAGNRLQLSDFRAALEKDGIAWPKFREEVRDEIIIARLREREVDNRIAVSDAEIDAYLANPQSAPGTSDTVELAHIMLRVPEGASPEELMRIHARAEGALDEIRKGEDFAKVAASYSDASDALSGGKISPRPLDRLPSLYAEAAQKLKPGEASEILRSPAGFHIVKLIDRKGGVAVLQPVRQTHVRHILIKVNDTVSENDAERKITMLKERLDHGADFAELARLYSNDLSAAKGGDIGWVYPGDTVPEFEKVMDALKVGEVSPPVATPFGYHLIQVMDRRVDEASPERQRLAARQALRDRKSDEAYQDWLRQLRDRTYVEYHLEDKRD